MYLIVAGGGKVGYYLAKELIDQGHEVLVIEKDARRAAEISNDLGNVVLRGNADEAATLQEAGANRAQVVLAVTGDDEDNLVICQVAKRRFEVKRAIARINNPKNEEIFRLLGIDATVSSTDVILGILEQEIPQETLVPLLRMRHADVEVVEAVLTEDSAVIGKPLRELNLPADSIIAVIIRDGMPIFPTRGHLTLAPGDEIVALTRSTHEEDLRRTFFAVGAGR